MPPVGPMPDGEPSPPFSCVVDGDVCAVRSPCRRPAKGNVAAAAEKRDDAALGHLGRPSIAADRLLHYGSRAAPGRTLRFRLLKKRGPNKEESVWLCVDCSKNGDRVTVRTDSDECRFVTDPDAPAKAHTCLPSQLPEATGQPPAAIATRAMGMLADKAQPAVGGANCPSACPPAVCCAACSAVGEPHTVATAGDRAAHALRHCALFKTMCAALPAPMTMAEVVHTADTALIASIYDTCFPAGCDNEHVPQQQQHAASTGHSSVAQQQRRSQPAAVPQQQQVHAASTGHSPVAAAQQRRQQSQHAAPPSPSPSSSIASIAGPEPKRRREGNAGEPEHKADYKLGCDKDDAPGGQEAQSHEPKAETVHELQEEDEPVRKCGRGPKADYVHQAYDYAAGRQLCIAVRHTPRLWNTADPEFSREASKVAASWAVFAKHKHFVELSKHNLWKPKWQGANATDEAGAMQRGKALMYWWRSIKERLHAAVRPLKHLETDAPKGVKLPLDVKMRIYKRCVARGGKYYKLLAFYVPMLFEGERPNRGKHLTARQSAAKKGKSRAARVMRGKRVQRDDDMSDESSSSSQSDEQNEKRTTVHPRLGTVQFHPSGRHYRLFHAGRHSYNRNGAQNRPTVADGDDSVKQMRGTPTAADGDERVGGMHPWRHRQARRAALRGLGHVRKVSKQQKERRLELGRAKEAPRRPTDEPGSSSGRRWR